MPYDSDPLIDLAKQVPMSERMSDTGRRIAEAIVAKAAKKVDASIARQLEVEQMNKDMFTARAQGAGSAPMAEIAMPEPQMPDLAELGAPESEEPPASTDAF